ncbi:hypothetical protein L1987_74837 [Smallanthus sonchifolius]|uniref:Uncharacterized protein n=1 Tax=Smallanthus sonchifolius TaxID=185202 RepID=A0ACB9A3A8_9ASTR|nr:hypothetical protein L1987_74837 [Smallanthus sonchifolius]
MSWLSRSNHKPEPQLSDDDSPQSPRRGVNEDLSEITKTLTRQFWGVASLIVPPVPAGHFNERSEPSDLAAISGVRRDFAEIGGRFRSGISKLSNNINDFLLLESEDDDYDSTDGDGDTDDAVGVTDEVVAFASDIAMHPETWLEFPLPEDEDFDLSDAQQEHVLAVESLAPRLSALRIELCPNYMTDSSFWKIYFVLLHPRLERDAADVLSTPKIVKARALLTHGLKNRSYSENMFDSKTKSPPFDATVIETVKHPIQIDDVQIVDKSVVQEESREDKDEVNWLKEGSSETVTNRVTILIESNEDVSFSDLEDDDDDDDDGNIPIHYMKAAHASDSSMKDSLGQVSDHNFETKESNDWLDVVDIDVA